MKPLGTFLNSTQGATLHCTPSVYAHTFVIKLSGSFCIIYRQYGIQKLSAFDICPSSNISKIQKIKRLKDFQKQEKLCISFHTFYIVILLFKGKAILLQVLKCQEVESFDFKIMGTRRSSFLSAGHIYPQERFLVPIFVRC
jgi:hypothetical protein